MKRDTFKSIYRIRPDRISFLVARFNRQCLNDAEREELDEWLNESEQHQMLFEELTEPGRFEREKDDWYDTGLEDMQSAIESAIVSMQTKKINNMKIIWLIGSAAALIFAIAAYLLYRLFFPNLPEWSRFDSKSPILMLSGNKRIMLNDQRGDTMVTSQSTIHFSKPGSLRYESKTGSYSLATYNVLQVPKEYTYKIILQDGTKVWLNEGTSLRFPEVFGPDERSVQLRGEAYFEIIKDVKPFVIRVSNAKISSNSGELNITDYRGQRTAVALVKGDGYLDGNFSDLRLKEGHRATIEARGKIVMEERWLGPFINWKKEAERLNGE